MFKKLFVVVIIVIIGICLAGCLENNEKPVSTENTLAAIETEIVEENAEQTVYIEENDLETSLPIADDAGNNNTPCPSIGEDIASEYIFDSYFTVEDIMSSFGSNEEAIMDKFDGTVLYNIIGSANYAYEELYNDKYGLFFIIEWHQDVQYIEIEQEKVHLSGITKESNFDDVKAVLGDTEVVTNVHELLGLKRYELVYEYEGNYIRIYSFDELGESGLYFCFTNDYETKYGFFDINSDEINRFFDMTMEEIQTELGVGTNPFENQLKYEESGVLFVFNEEGSELQKMFLSRMYQIEGLRDYMSVEQTQKVMGKVEIIERMTSEDGMLTTLRYEYDDFALEVNYLLGIDNFPWWDILRK